MIPQLEFYDAHYFRDALSDQDSLMVDVEIRRCIGINKNTDYPGEKPEVLRNSIFTRAELRITSLQEVTRTGGVLMAGDMQMRCDVELRGGGGEQPELDFGDKFNAQNVADIISVKAPFQGDWYVVGVPETAQLVTQQGAIFWNAYIRRVKTGNRGK
jgi:hypothetical protein